MPGEAVAVVRRHRLVGGGHPGDEAGVRRQGRFGEQPMPHGGGVAAVDQPRDQAGRPVGIVARFAVARQLVQRQRMQGRGAVGARGVVRRLRRAVGESGLHRVG